ACCVTGFVHLLARRDALRNDAGALQAAIPPGVRAMLPHGLVMPAIEDGSPPASPRYRLLAGKQVVGRLCLLLQNQALQIEPERRLRDRQVTDLATLGEDRQPLAVVVEVLELDSPHRAFAQAVVEQKPQ